MKPRNHQINKSSNQQIKKKPAVYSSAKKVTSTLFSSVDNWLEKRSKVLLIIIFGLSILFSLLLFQARMDVGGDDSGYVLRAYDFIHKGVFPSFQGPLYPMFLSIFISFLGIKVIFLKFLSVIFNFFGLLFLYKSFKNRIPNLVLYTVLFITAINSYILNFASQTYSEAFFTGLQFLFLYYFFKLLDRLNKNESAGLKDLWKPWLIVGILLYCLVAAKNAGIVALGGLLLYFVLIKKYKYALYLLGAFIAVYLPVNLIEKALWHTDNQFGQQLNWFLLKDPYNVAKGTETLSGIIQRIPLNGDMYFSKRLFQVLGLRADSEVSSIPWLTFFVLLFFAFSVYRIFKSKNNYLLATFLFTFSMTILTFAMLQAGPEPERFDWSQPTRLILTFIPLYLILFFFAIYDTFKKSAWGMQILSVFVFALFVISGIRDTLIKTKANIPVLSKNLKGDIYCGFTPDWVNYLKLSQWCENLPKDSLVACRKGPMSSVYANGRPFFNIAKVDSIHSTNADSVIALFKRNHVRYVLLAKLRTSPNVADGSFLNGVHRMIEPIYRKYPQELKFIRQEGTSEEAQLWEINY